MFSPCSLSGVRRTPLDGTLGVRRTLVKIGSNAVAPAGGADGDEDRVETARPREPLSRERILGAAVALADQDGVESLSMRRLAQELGVVPMALYKHVANKDELLDGMIDVVVGEIDPPPRAPTGRRRCASASSRRAARCCATRGPRA